MQVQLNLESDRDHLTAVRAAAYFVIITVLNVFTLL